MKRGPDKEHGKGSGDKSPGRSGTTTAHIHAGNLERGLGRGRGNGTQRSLLAPFSFTLISESWMHNNAYMSICETWGNIATSIYGVCNQSLTKICTPVLTCLIRSE